MSAFATAFWAELLKARRSKVSRGVSLGFMILPLVGGLFMVILKDPERAQAMGLIRMKAQLAGGTADWATFFDILLQGSAIGGAIVFAFLTAWVFGREFSDHTVKEWLAVPTRRETIIAAKLALTGVWVLGLSLLAFALGLVIGRWVDIPGWSAELGWNAFGTVLMLAALNSMLLPLVALFASAGGGYLAPLGWAVATVALAQIAAVMGWGDWFPWSVPALVSGMAGPRSEMVSTHSYLVVGMTCILGIWALFRWWRRADQAR